MDTVNNTKELPEVLIGNVLEGDDKLEFWPTMHHGHLFEALQFEAFIAMNARKMCSSYNGGMWEFVVLDATKKIYYIYPRMDGLIKAEGILNHAIDELDPRVFGIIVTLLSLAWRGDITGDERYYSAFHALREFVEDKIEPIINEHEGMAKEDMPIEAQKAWATSSAIYRFLD